MVGLKKKTQANRRLARGFNAEDNRLEGDKTEFAIFQTCHRITLYLYNVRYIR